MAGYNEGDYVTLEKDVPPYPKGCEVKIKSVNDDNSYDIIGFNGPEIWVQNISEDCFK